MNVFLVYKSSCRSLNSSFFANDDLSDACFTFKRILRMKLKLFRKPLLIFISVFAFSDVDAESILFCSYHFKKIMCENGLTNL